jgi:putative protease
VSSDQKTLYTNIRENYKMKRKLPELLAPAGGREQLEAAVSNGADGVIVQDMGLIRLLRNYLPDMPMHLPTQGTIYNPQALDFIRDLGISRVVLARELTLEEIYAMTAGSIEIEVFVHGALCICYSGQCQMSRLLAAGKTGGSGGRSGNRGLCAQPCRLEYIDDRNRRYYALSPKDICTIDSIPALCEAGVDSFKIEGRLKSAEYVATVTRIYRKYLNLYNEGRWPGEIDPWDAHELEQIFNRGGFTEGYLYGNPGEALLSGESPKNRGCIHGSCDFGA